jgi:hypothetical protein
MTAIYAAIVELKAHCEHTWDVIHTLERFAAVVEDAHGAPSAIPGAAPEPSASTHLVVDPVKRTQPTTPKAAKPAAPHSTVKGSGTEAIAGVLYAAGHPMTPLAIIQTSRMARYQVFKALKELVRARRVVARGQRRGRTYELATQLRPGAVAGTQAAPPVGPPSANGRRVPPEAFDVAWNGTKERNGDAPSILPPRERKP